jgi:hypothetical protein
VGLSVTALEEEVLRMPWRAVLAEPFVAVRSIDRRPPHSAVAAIPYLGAWSGWLTVRADVLIVHDIAARMRSPELVRAGDLDDATRWLAEAIARGLHVVVDPEARIGPAAVLEPERPWTPRWCRPAARMLFASGERLLGIALDERMPVAARQTGLYPSDLDDAEVRPRETAEYPPMPSVPISKRRVF